MGDGRWRPVDGVVEKLLGSFPRTPPSAGAESEREMKFGLRRRPPERWPKSPPNGPGRSEEWRDLHVRWFMQVVAFAAPMSCRNGPHRGLGIHDPFTFRPQGYPQRLWITLWEGSHEVSFRTAETGVRSGARGSLWRSRRTAMEGARRDG